MMTMKRWAAGAAAAALALGLTACGGDGMRQEMQQERQEDIIDEREDEQLNTPGTEYQQEQREDRMDETEDER
ncbi:hypothetical protein [Paenibacillus sp.]|uniref:hypothetical protein n=1 Tax=Paenibacillus sp. TaxID=58172 RepID=UPI002D654A91|nr:hypothetical protein [Paenibacillus sp.]HZG88206.1 hypothetical protein [Paenibacillus sp.]